jgi:hypothetical protein
MKNVIPSLVFICYLTFTLSLHLKSTQQFQSASVWAPGMVRFSPDRADWCNVLTPHRQTNNNFQIPPASSKPAWFGFFGKGSTFNVYIKMQMPNTGISLRISLNESQASIEETGNVFCRGFGFSNPNHWNFVTVFRSFTQLRVQVNQHTIMDCNNANTDYGKIGWIALFFTSDSNNYKMCGLGVRGQNLGTNLDLGGEVPATQGPFRLSCNFIPPTYLQTTTVLASNLNPLGSMIKLRIRLTHGWLIFSPTGRHEDSVFDITTYWSPNTPDAKNKINVKPGSYECLFDKPQKPAFATAYVQPGGPLDNEWVSYVYNVATGKTRIRVQTNTNSADCTIPLDLQRYPVRYLLMYNWGASASDLANVCGDAIATDLPAEGYVLVKGFIRHTVTNSNVRRDRLNNVRLVFEMTFNGNFLTIPATINEDGSYEAKVPEGTAKRSFSANGFSEEVKELPITSANANINNSANLVLTKDQPFKIRGYLKEGDYLIEDDQLRSLNVAVSFKDRASGQQYEATLKEGSMYEIELYGGNYDRIVRIDGGFIIPPPFAYPVSQNSNEFQGINTIVLNRRKFKVKGYVKNASTGNLFSAEDLRSGRISFNNINANILSDGIYEVEVIQGTYTIQAFVNEYSQISPSSPVNVNGNSELDDQFTVSLKKLKLKIRGYIKDSEGNLLSGLNGSINFNNINARILDGGIYEVELSPGSYSITSSFAGYTQSSPTGSITINANSDLQNAFTIVLEKQKFHLKGAIKDESGSALPADVLTSARILLNNISTRVNADGTYEADVEPGTYTVDAVFNGYNVVSPTSITVSGNSDLENNNAIIVKQQKLRIKGYIRDDLGNAVAGNILSDGQILFGGEDAQINEDGTYELELSAGRYRISVNFEGFFLISPSAPVQVRSNSILQDAFTIVLHKQTWNVRGYIKDKDTGNIIPDRELANGMIQFNNGVARILPGGIYEIDVVPGRYTVTTTIEGFTLFSPNEMNVTENTNENNSRNTITLKRKPFKTTIKGFLKDSTTDRVVPIQNIRQGNALVKFTNKETGEAFTASISNASVYSVELMTGKYERLVTINGFAEFRDEVRIYSGSDETNQINTIVLSPNYDGWRIVLTWENTQDLDAFLGTPKPKEFIYHTNILSADGKAKIDVDNQTGYGPETITIDKNLMSGTYKYFVSEYIENKPSKQRQLIQTGAKVSVYKNNVKIFEATPPNTAEDVYWSVFRIDGNTGELIPTNRFVNKTSQT